VSSTLAPSLVKRIGARRSSPPRAPRVSIVIPAKDEAGSLPGLLRSLRALEFPADRLELIVVDHGSRDDTPAIAAAAGARVIRHEGGTVAAARNAGARAAQGGLLAFLDADCSVAPDWLARALTHFQDPAIGAAGSYYTIPLDRPSWVRRVLHAQAAGLPAGGDAAWIPAGNFVVRRDAFWKAGAFDERLTTCEDVDLCFRLARTHRVVNDRRIRCLHHGEPVSLRELFRKELWRGRDNLSGAFRHGLTWREVPSLLLPVMFLLALLSLAASPFLAAVLGWSHVRLALAAIGAAFLPVLAIAGAISVRARRPGCFLPALPVAACYLAARALAPLRQWTHV